MLWSHVGMFPRSISWPTHNGLSRVMLCPPQRQGAFISQNPVSILPRVACTCATHCTPRWRGGPRVSRGVAVVIKGGDRGGSDAMGSCVYGASPVAARQPIVLSGPICGAAYFVRQPWKPWKPCASAIYFLRVSRVSRRFLKKTF